MGLVLLAAGGAGCSVPRPDLPEPGESLAAYYRRAAGVERLPVSSPRFYDSGPAIRAEMLDLVDSAQDHILLDSFLLNDGPASREILDALAEKAARGVTVRVIGDASSRFVMEPEAFEYLESRGVAAAEFNPVKGWRLLTPPILLERDHRKFWVVDGRRVLLGGANLSDLSLIPPGQGGNRDLMVGFDSPAAARLLTRSFVETWSDSEASLEIREADFRPAADSPANGPEYWFFNEEKVRKRPCMTAVMLEGLYASARKSVWLVEPYTFTSPGILAGIRSMTARGVEVNLVLSSQVRAPRFRYASYYGIKDLLSAGARVWIFDSETSPLHYKCALVDDRLAYVGSANLNYRSLRLSRELNVVFDDPVGVAEIRKVVESVRKGCREVDEKEARAYRTLPFATWWAIMQTAG